MNQSYLVHHTSEPNQTAHKHFSDYSSSSFSSSGWQRSKTFFPQCGHRHKALERDASFLHRISRCISARVIYFIAINLVPFAIRDASLSMCDGKSGATTPIIILWLSVSTALAIGLMTESKKDSLLMLCHSLWMETSGETGTRVRMCGMTSFLNGVCIEAISLIVEYFQP